ncbi:hypothetical protein [Fusobacterium pseudoperiodonticum]|uniref:hypothetical protein n=2 Tax=Fusobacterium pseudoperiodonticum TaxID=2663009 RepID=UPI0030D4A976
MQILLLIFKLLGFFINHASEKKKFYIDDKWTIELPPDWERIFLEIELELDNSPIFETIFFKPGSDLSIGVYYLNLLKDDNYRDVEADIPDVIAVFEEIMDKIEDKKEYKIPNYKNSKFKAYEYTYYENDKKFYAIKTGFFMKGCLLRVNIASTIKKEVEKAMYYLFSIKQVDLKDITYFDKDDSYK